MNGKSGENNVEIKSGQQVCVVFFFFFLPHIAGPAFCNDRGRKGRRGDDFSEGDGSERRRNKKGGHGVSHVITFLKDKSKKLPMLTFEVFTFLQNVCPFPLMMRLVRLQM